MDNHNQPLTFLHLIKYTEKNHAHEMDRIANNEHTHTRNQKKISNKTQPNCIVMYRNTFIRREIPTPENINTFILLWEHYLMLNSCYLIINIVRGGKQTNCKSDIDLNNRTG